MAMPVYLASLHDISSLGPKVCMHLLYSGLFGAPEKCSSLVVAVFLYALMRLLLYGSQYSTGFRVREPETVEDCKFHAIEGFLHWTCSSGFRGAPLCSWWPSRG